MVKRTVGSNPRWSIFLFIFDLCVSGSYTVYPAFVRPKLEYGNLAYWSPADTNLEKFDRVQQQISNMFDQLSIRSLQHRRKVSLANFCMLTPRRL